MKTILCGAAACALLASSAVRADTVDMRYVGVGKGQSVRLLLSGSPMDVWSGQIAHEFSNGTGLGAKLNGSHMTYCTDLWQHVSGSWTTYTLMDLADMPSPAMGEDKAHAIGDVYLGSAGMRAGPGFNNDMAAAFQLAVWEILVDFDANAGRSSLSVLDGDFEAQAQGGGALGAGVAGYLDQFLNMVGTGKRSYQSVIGLASRGSQDQIIDVPVVPLPTAAGMAMAGLGAMAAVRRRRA